MKIAILTSGGDSAGMNAVVRAVVKVGILKGCETWVVREGYEGLVRGNTEALSEQSLDEEPVDLPDNTSPDGTSFNLIHNLRFGDGDLLKDGTGDHPGTRSLKGRYIVRVGFDDVRAWFAEGGTLIGTARSKTFRTPEGRLQAAYNMIKEGLDALVVCGGDGSLTGADVFRAEWPKLVEALQSEGRITAEKAKLHAHLRIVGLVGSIDNDMSMTDLTIGAPTALHRICEAIDNINSTATSHSRAFVLEVMGRHCGWLALLAGVSGGADFIFIPERPPTSESWEDEMCECIHRHREVGKRKTIVIVAEGATDRDLNPIKADHVKDVLTERLGLDTRVTTLGHTQRGGRPCAYDRVLPTLQGMEAVETLLEATPTSPSYMIGIQENKITRVPLMEAVAMTRAVSAAIEAKDFEKAMSYRDPEFKESFEGFLKISTLDQEKVPEEQRMRVALMHMGAPAGGMNAATRAAVRYCIRHGHTPIAVHNGFRGLLDDEVHELSWLGVDSWTARGGSELGTNRTLPSVDLDIQFVAHHGGGQETLSCFPHSNGSDTSLNALVDACDAIKQSASASRNRVFVVETQGGKCGYLATVGALATGASLVYTPEQGMDLDTLRRDVRFLKTRYKLDAKGRSEGRLVIKNEVASQVYTTDVMQKMLKEEGGTLFDARSASLGHTLQGGVPSPMDRARAVRLSLKCMAFLEREHVKLLQQPVKARHATPDSAAIITIQSSSLKWVPVQEMVAHADMQNRRGKNPWWANIKELAELLAGRPQLIGIHSKDLAQYE
ncbi:6-phosphofructokinase [Lentinula edodes]|uniref:6-phosphofructokinase n=1 Tax=Lentinula edodes TaxID=5353 RepID=A0A1Q3EJR7_LENED|nr:6-phosphofructokinase [Lentinula edodes]